MKMAGAGAGGVTEEEAKPVFAAWCGGSCEI